MGLSSLAVMGNSLTLQLYQGPKAGASTSKSHDTPKIVGKTPEPLPV